MTSRQYQNGWFKPPPTWEYELQRCKRVFPRKTKADQQEEECKESAACTSESTQWIQTTLPVWSKRRRQDLCVPWTLRAKPDKDEEEVKEPPLKKAKVPKTPREPDEDELQHAFCCACGQLVWERFRCELCVDLDICRACVDNKRQNDPSAYKPGVRKEHRWHSDAHSMVWVTTPDDIKPPLERPVVQFAAPFGFMQPTELELQLLHGRQYDVS